MSRLSPIENLAREICWAGFTTKAGRAGKTKASYWKALPESTRQNYICEANRFSWVLHSIPVDALNALTPTNRPVPGEIERGK